MVLNYNSSVVGSWKLCHLESAATMPDLSIDVMDVKAEDEMLDVSCFHCLFFSVLAVHFFFIRFFLDNVHVLKTKKTACTLPINVTCNPEYM